MNHFIRFYFFAAILVLFSSCAHLVKLDLAQRNFNEAASIENAARFGQQANASSPESHYALAYAALKDALKKKGQLDQDGLLGNTYALQALCEWKLQEYSEARKTAKIALTYLIDDEKPNGAILTRDAAVMKSLDALITIDETNQAVYRFFQSKGPIPLDSCRQFLEQYLWKTSGAETGNLQAALGAITGVLKQVPIKHEVRNYLVMAQLGGTKVWSDALHFLNNNRKKFPSGSTEREAIQTYWSSQRALFKTEREELLDDFAQLFQEGTNSPLYLHWKFILG